MYVCMCHGFTDSQVRKAVADGCRSVAAVYRCLADRPQCGKCVPHVRAMVKGAPPCARAAAMLAGAAAGAGD